MKPNPEHLQFLKAKLSGILKYRETYAEVYDHILLALTQGPAVGHFEETVSDIIEKDFGGEQSLRQIEDRCRVAAIKKVKAQYKYEFFSWFKSAPSLAALVATFLLLNYVAMQSFIAAEVTFGVIVLVPELSFIIRRIRLGYLFGDARPSLRDTILKKMTYGSLFIYLRLAIISQSIVILFSIPKQQVVYVNQLVLTVYAVLFIIRAITMLKLFKGDIQLSLNQ